MPNFIVCIGLSMGVCMCNVHLSQLGSSKTKRKCGKREKKDKHKNQMQYKSFHSEIWFQMQSQTTPNIKRTPFSPYVDNGWNYIFAAPVTGVTFIALFSRSTPFFFLLNVKNIPSMQPNLVCPAQCGRTKFIARFMVSNATFSIYIRRLPKKRTHTHDVLRERGKMGKKVLYRRIYMHPL